MPNIKDHDVLSLGELVVEFFHKTPDVSFNKPAEILGPYPSGAAAIFIDTLARLGAGTGYIGTIGDDEFGDCIINRLGSDNVNTDHIYRLEDATTGVAFRMTYSDGGRKFIYHIGNAAPGRLGKQHIDESFVGKFRHLHISGNVLAFSESARTGVLKAVDIAYGLGIPISLDPNLRLEMMKPQEIKDLLGPVLKKTTFFFPSMGEITYVTGRKNEDEGAKALLDQGIEVIARKEGQNGSTVITKDRIIHIGPFNVEELDSTGCGDAYCGAFVYGVLQGWPLEVTGRFSNAVGAITANRLGPMEGILSLGEVQEFIKIREQEG